MTSTPMILSTAGWSEITRGEAIQIFAVLMLGLVVVLGLVAAVFVGLFRLAAAGDRAIIRRKERKAQDRERLAIALRKGLTDGP